MHGVAGAPCFAHRLLGDFGRLADLQVDLAHRRGEFFGSPRDSRDIAGGVVGGAGRARHLVEAGAGQRGQLPGIGLHLGRGADHRLQGARRATGEIADQLFHPLLARQLGRLFARLFGGQFLGLLAVDLEHVERMSQAAYLVTIVEIGHVDRQIALGQTAHPPGNDAQGTRHAAGDQTRRQPGQHRHHGTDAEEQLDQVIIDMVDIVKQDERADRPVPRRETDRVGHFGNRLAAILERGAIGDEAATAAGLDDLIADHPHAVHIGGVEADLALAGGFDRHHRRSIISLDEEIAVVAIAQQSQLVMRAFLRLLARQFTRGFPIVPAFDHMLGDLNQIAHLILAIAHQTMPHLDQTDPDCNDQRHNQQRNEQQ